MPETQVNQESKSGIYKYNPETGEVEKVSDHPHGTPSPVYFPKASGHSGHHFENLDDKTFYSAGEKRQYMKERGIAEL